MGLRYGGKIISDYSAMQGPAPSGFHVPSKDEWVSVHNIWTALGGGSSDGANFGIALKLPFAGHRSYSSASVNYQGSYGRYWSSSCYDASNANNLWIGSSTLNPQSSYFRALGFSVRCFKDTPTIPTSSWTKLYGTSIESGGIFWSSTDGLISLSSDGQTWITIQDKNLGATAVRNSGDTLSEANCGKYYQRGNNYGFPRTGSVTTSSTRVDASNYGPGNYYSSSTFITRSGSPFRRDTTNNGNLWGGETGVQQLPAPIVKRYYGGKMVNDYSAMRGPCPDGFHVPMRDEFYAVLDVWTGLGGLDTEGDNFIMALKLPKTGRRLSDASTGSQNSMGYYWGTTRPTGSNAHVMTCRSSKVTVTNNVCAGGLSIRPFKDTPVVPTSSWTKLYGTSIEAGGIFWSSTDGLISLSSDGTNRITIADKNLGATQVWNSGDTLSEANCGKYYQRGNNYGFPRTGTISNTSSTQVDTTGYGPGNYYLDDTFIIGNDDWASPRNANLRGGVTGVQQRPAEVIKVYKGNTLIREKS